LLDPYKQRDWLYHHYVVKRMNTKPIAELLKNKYNIEVTPQTIYNWAARYDLLKLRGKGRKLSAGRRKDGSRSTGNVHPRRQRQEAMRKSAKNRKRGGRR